MWMFAVCSTDLTRAPRQRVASFTRQGEISMRVDRIPSKDIGLRHVLENGLALLQGAELEADRRVQVLNSLQRIFSEAERGSAALGVAQLTAALNERRAIDRFSDFYHHLRHEFGDEVAARLSEAKVALDDLRDTGTTTEERAQELKDVLLHLVTSIRRERALSPLKQPRAIVY